jgi:hypothetical protein
MPALMWPASSMKRGSKPLCFAFHDRPRIEGHEPERLRLRGVDDLPDVDVHPIAHQRQFVHQTDVDGAERVLEQLDHLGHARRADGHDGLDRRAVQRRRELQAVGREAADDFRHVVRVERRVAGVDALGREGEIEVATRLEPCCLEQRLHDLVGRSWIRRRLETDEQAGMEMRGDRLHCADDVGHVRVLRLAQWRRHADVDGVELADDREVGGRVELPGLAQGMHVGG